jgi:hypothetical protein
MATQTNYTKQWTSHQTTKKNTKLWFHDNINFKIGWLICQTPLSLIIASNMCGGHSCTDSASTFHHRITSNLLALLSITLFFSGNGAHHHAFRTLVCLHRSGRFVWPGRYGGSCKNAKIAYFVNPNSSYSSDGNASYSSISIIQDSCLPSVDSLFCVYDLQHQPLNLNLNLNPKS